MSLWSLISRFDVRWTVLGPSGRLDFEESLKGSLNGGISGRNLEVSISSTAALFVRPCVVKQVQLFTGAEVKEALLNTLTLYWCKLYSQRIF